MVGLEWNATNVSNEMLICASGDSKVFRLNSCNKQRVHAKSALSVCNVKQQKTNRHQHQGHIYII